MTIRLRQLMVGDDVICVNGYSFTIQPKGGKLMQTLEEVRALWDDHMSGKFNVHGERTTHDILIIKREGSVIYDRKVVIKAGLTMIAKHLTNLGDTSEGQLILHALTYIEFTETMVARLSKPWTKCDTGLPPESTPVLVKWKIDDQICVTTSMYKDGQWCVPEDPTDLANPANYFDDDTVSEYLPVEWAAIPK